MYRHLFRYLIAASVSLLLIGIVALRPQDETSVAQAAAPRAAFALYLPMVMRAGPAPVQQLIQDGSFEAGLPNSFWTTSSTMSSSILDNSSNPPAHTGAWKAWLGGSNLAQEILWQTFTVPTGTTSLQVSFWWQVSTTEPSPQTFDRMDVRLRNSAGTTTLQNLDPLYDGDTALTWKQSTFTPTLSYAGQTIQIAFVVQTDANNPTSFFVDDVSVQAKH
jgi:hypothetical protein